MTAKNVSKTVWSIIDKSMGKTKGRDENIQVRVDPNNELCSDPAKVSEAFNSFYCNIAKDLQNGNNSTGTKVKQQNQSMFLTPVEKEDKLLALKKT